VLQCLLNFNFSTQTPPKIILVRVIFEKGSNQISSQWWSYVYKLARNLLTNCANCKPIRVHSSNDAYLVPTDEIVYVGWKQQARVVISHSACSIWIRSGSSARSIRRRNSVHHLDRWIHLVSVPWTHGIYRWRFNWLQAQGRPFGWPPSDHVAATETHVYNKWFSEPTELILETIFFHPSLFEGKKVCRN
jgi:hypothetical protein